MTPRQRFHRALEHCEAARNAAENALAQLVEDELERLSRRFPTRRIEFHSGMGSSSLSIYYRNVDRSKSWNHNAFTYGSVYYHVGYDWPESVAIPCPRLWEAFETYENTIGDGKDPGVGSIIYENGVRIKKLGE